MMKDKVSVTVTAGLVFIYEDKFIPAIVINQPGGRVDGKGSASDYQHVGIADVGDCFSSV